MNAQEVYDLVKAHLLTQNAKAIYTHPDDEMKPGFAFCRYRAEDGRKCAVGCLIPDDVYSPRMEGKGVGMILDHYPELAHLEPHFDLLRQLQRVHDATGVESWPAELAMVAEFYGLTP